MSLQLLQYAPDKKIQNYLFSFKAKLGKGAYGTVYLGKHEKSSNITLSFIIKDQVVALKVVDKKILTSEYSQHLITQEIEIMKKINNANIVKLVDVLQSINNTYIITEYCNGGDLRDYLKKKRILSEEEALVIMKNIFLGVKDLIANGIIHRDIKPANILINDGVFKLTDFGFAREVHNHQETIMNSLVGTPLYMSPQILKRQSYTSKCDIWSLGLIFYEMVYGVTPWHSQNLVELMSKIDVKPLTFPPSPKVSEPVKELIKQMLQLKEERRIDWDNIFKHPAIALYQMSQPVQTDNNPQPIISNTSTLIGAQPQTVKFQSTGPSEQQFQQQQVQPQLSNQRSNSNMNAYLPQKYNNENNRSFKNYLEQNQTLPRVRTDIDQVQRERSQSTFAVEKFKTQLIDLKSQQTPPMGKNYNSSKACSNNESIRTPSALNSNSTNTTISSGRPKLPNKIQQFDPLDERGNVNTVEVDKYQGDVVKHEKKRSIFQDIKIQQEALPSKLKRTNSLTTKLGSVPMQSNQNTTQQILQLIKNITNQLDFIPNHIEIKSELSSFIDSQRKKLSGYQPDPLFKKDDVVQLKGHITRIIQHIENNKKDHFLVQMQVMLLLLLCYFNIVNTNMQLKFLTVSPMMLECVKSVQDTQKQQLSLFPHQLQDQIYQQIQTIQ